MRLRPGRAVGKTGNDSPSLVTSCDPFPATESMTHLFNHHGVYRLLIIPALMFADESPRYFLAMCLEILGNRSPQGARKSLLMSRFCRLSDVGAQRGHSESPVSHHPGYLYPCTTLLAIHTVLFQPHSCRCHLYTNTPKQELRSDTLVWQSPVQ